MTDANARQQLQATRTLLKAAQVEIKHLKQELAVIRAGAGDRMLRALAEEVCTMGEKYLTQGNEPPLHAAIDDLREHLENH